MTEKCDCEKCELKGLFFQNVNKSEIESICYRKVEKTYEKGDKMIRTGSEIQEFLYLKQGLVKLFRNSGYGKEQIISIAKPFDFVSLLSIFSEKSYNYSVTALENSVVCVLDLKEIKELVLTNGMFAMNLLEKMSKASDHIIINLLNIREKHLRGRIAHILLYFADNIYNRNSFDLPISRREIADYIGMTTENVIRILSEFRKDKIIRINGKTIDILDDMKLKMISDLG